MTFRVELTSQADHDANEILDWLLAHHAGNTGRRWLAELEDAIASLASFPKRYPLSPESNVFPFEVRHMLHGRKPHVYRVLFMIEGDTVYVLHIRHGRRQPITQ